MHQVLFHTSAMSGVTQEYVSCKSVDDRRTLRIAEKDLSVCREAGIENFDRKKKS